MIPSNNFTQWTYFSKIEEETKEETYFGQRKTINELKEWFCLLRARARAGRRARGVLPTTWRYYEQLRHAYYMAVMSARASAYHLT